MLIFLGQWNGCYVAQKISNSSGNRLVVLVQNLKDIHFNKYFLLAASPKIRYAMII